MHENISFVCKLMESLYSVILIIIILIIIKFVCPQKCVV